MTKKKYYKTASIPYCKRHKSKSCSCESMICGHRDWMHKKYYGFSEDESVTHLAMQD